MKMKMISERKEALKQQEALLKEMMNQSNPPSSQANTEMQQAPMASLEATAPKQIANQGVSYDNNYQGTTANKEEIEFESLLNNFQNVASSKPDLLAKKIEVWLDD